VEIPAYSGEPYVVLEDNQPDFTEDELTVSDYEFYSELDDLGRCGTATACVGLEIMPTQERGSIGQVKPSGWQTVKYDFVDGNYLYNRCHLIGYQLSGENANEKNLITGTRYMNVTGMLPFENLVADYVKETENHVLYRVTPVFIGENLVADGVEMEAESIEDDGEGVLFHVFVYNVQPGVTINYADGSSWRTEEDSSQDSASEEMTDSYIVNTNTGKFHLLDCYSVSQMKESNKQYFEGSRDELIAEGYSPCKNCNP
jgi:DNA-entry nuclease